ncbi:MAG: Fic family protein [Nitrospiraceae bacterium]|nr:Fic family protein [Nitrospiraceae bacterium]MDA8208605.1 Fic family protein [Actinomycetota bacterium]
MKFQLDQAIGIIFRNETVPQREPEVQDLAGTYAVVSDVAQMSTVATSGAEFLEILKHRHRQVMRGRPEYAPGSFKTRPNSAGRTVFVQPELVEGTLVEGFTGLLELDGAFQRAVYTMFLVSEVHPFIDGNGRVARIAMNAELVAKDEARIIIPPVFQDDYLGALRRLSRGGDPRPVIQALRFAQDVVAACDFSTLASARSDLETAHAFHEGDEGFRLRIPDLTTRASGDATTA